MPDDLTLLSYNIRYGGVGRERALAEAISACKPDLVVLQEATRADVVERVARDAGMTTWAASEGHSLAFTSRVPVARWQWHHPWRLRRAFLEITLESGRGRVFGVHLSAVHSNWTERRRVRELRTVLACTGQHLNEFHIVVGDFNTLAPGEQLDVSRLPPRLKALVWLGGGRIRWQTIQMMLEAGYIDGYRMLHPADRGFTFPASDPHIRLDYAFVPGTFAPRVTACDVVRTPSVTSVASDHLPLMTRFLLN
jgi:endonuclease/exonuclease/phosphatase family metal-dependent hydrolase